MAWNVVTGTISENTLCAAYSVSAVCGMAGCRDSKGCSESKPGTHPDERITAGRVDRDAPGEMELGAVAGAVEEAIGAAAVRVYFASERGGLPGGDIDTADAVVETVLQCMMGDHTDEELKRRSGRTV